MILIMNQLKENKMSTKEYFKERYRDYSILELDSIISGLLFSKNKDDDPLLNALTELVDEKLGL